MSCARTIVRGCVALMVQTAGIAPAVCQTQLPAATFEARVNEAVGSLANDPHFKGLSEQQRRDRIEFVAGNVLFALVHEVGHMLIAEMGLPVLGKEEDAADAFATLTGLKTSNAFADRVLTESARGWFLSDRRNQKEKIKTMFYDEHGLDKQRAYNIVCLMVGSDAEKFGELADRTKMPASRQATCQGDFSNASWSWEKALAPHLRKPDQPKTTIDVQYVDGGPRYETFARGFRHLMILEVVAAHLADRYVWRRPIALEMRSCDEPSAHWDLSTQKITVCYELAADFARLYAYSDEPRTARSSRKH